MKKIIIFLLSLTLLLSFASCAKKTDDDRIKIVATNFAMYDLARAAAGDTADVTMLLPPGNESHDFEAALSDVAAIADCDLFIYVGGESEDWVYDVLESLGSSKPNTFCAVDSVALLNEETVEGMESDGEDKVEADEHVWTSLGNAAALVNAIADEISALPGADGEQICANAAAYADEILALKDEMADMIAHAERNTIVVADRFPFLYLAKECGLDYYAAFSGCTSATEPSLATVNFLIEKVKSEDIPAVFVIEFSDGKTAKAVASETGCEILTLHSAHNVSKEDFDGGVTYLDIMRRNLDALKTALN